ncbi:MAG: hypothetical protein GY861_04705 [bacterium]|nr:hypothetical protein [bacterium]
MNEFNIEQYLSQEDMKETAKEAFRDKCSDCLEKDFERILSNIAYDVVWKAADEVLDNELQVKLKGKVEKVIDNLTDFAVFKQPDSWSRQPNKAYTLLMEVVEDSKPLIEQRVETIITSFDGKDFKLDMNERLEDMISVRLFGEL